MGFATCATVCGKAGVPMEMEVVGLVHALFIGGHILLAVAHALYRTSSSRRTKMSGQLMVASNVVWQMLGMPGHTIGS